MADARAALARLVAFPTVAGESNEELIDWAAGELEASGAAVRVLPAARPDARSLHAVLGPADVAGALLGAHTDVVAVEGQEWTSDPFVLREEGGRLYGRGTADMKGFVAAVLAAAREVRGDRLRRPLHVALSSDEELGCRGAPALIAALEDTIAPPAWCVVGEPTGMRVAERHKGKLAFRADVRGRACHSSRAPEGVNAVEYAARMIAGLREVQDALRGEARDEGFATPFATVSTGPIAGGVALNTVPDACRFEFEVRLMPGQDAAAVTRRIEGLAAGLTDEMRDVAPEARIDVATTTSYPPLAAADDGAVAHVVAALAGTDAGGAVDFGTEAGLYRTGLGVPVVVCGPGDMAQGHVADEYLEVEQLDRATKFVRRVGEWLSAERSAGA